MERCLDELKDELLVSDLVSSSDLRLDWGEELEN